MLLDSFSYIFEVCEAKYTAIESDVVLQACKLPDALKNVVPNLPQAFECCWDTCEQTFKSSQTYFNHVETCIATHVVEKWKEVLLAAGVVSSKVVILDIITEKIKIETRKILHILSLLGMHP
jgi:hypothetical protein